VTQGARGWRWTLLAGALGFTISFVFSSLLHFSRPLFLVPHTLAVSGFVILYARTERISPRIQLARLWRLGVVAGIALGVLLIRQVFSQPGSASPHGLALAGALTWYGVVYGVVDTLLLSVIPVLSLYGSRPAEELQRPGARWRWGLVALLGSAIVTAMYHAGFAEFRGPQLVQPVIGNTLITLAYLLTGSPLAAIVSHVLMHMAAVVHGMALTSQLPPHY
jgi:Type II CAAX prenyl endopeptidase Rce1-like